MNYRDQKSRNRGLADLGRRVGEIRPEIERRLRSGAAAGPAGAVASAPVRVLEIGMGLGTALMELRHLYGDRVELHGINRARADGDWPMVCASAVAHGVMCEAETQAAAPILFHYGDVSAGFGPLGLHGDYFDIVFSQAAFFWFADKARVIEEVDRVLRPDGVARLDLRIRRGGLPPERATSVIIRGSQGDIPFWTYVRRFPALRECRVRRRRVLALWHHLRGMRPPLITKQPYLEMRKTPGGLSLGLELAEVVDLHGLDQRWWGCQSIYRARGGE
jgi:SAM-dependent methyltransferase